MARYLFYFVLAIFVVIGLDVRMASAQLPDTIDLDQNEEDVRILGHEGDDRSGKAVASGDVNGDGIDDLIIGAYKADQPGNLEAGETYIIYGSASLSTPINLSGHQEDVRILGHDAGDWSGYAVACGDVNGDDTADVIIGAYYADQPGNLASGETYIIYGSASLPDTIDLAGHEENVRILGDDADDVSGCALACGDINGDDTLDLVIGAEGADPSGLNAGGETYIIYGSANLPDTIDLATDEENVRILGRAAGDYFGYAVACGDVNGDDTADVIVGAYGASNGGADAGKTYIFYGSANLPDTLDLNNFDWSVRIKGDDAYDHLGIAVTCGDINGDDTLDVIIGAYGADPPGGGQAGETYIIYGSAGLPANIDLGNHEENVRILGDDADENSGWAVGSGDIDNDGIDDVVIGAPWADTDVDAGETYIIYGSASLPDTINLAGGEEDVRILGDDANDFSGIAVASGDINGNGADDLIIGATRPKGYAGPHPGETYVIYGCEPFPPTMESIVEPEGQWYNITPTFSNFSFDDNSDLDDGWYQMDSWTGAWTTLFTDVVGISWDNDGWTVPGFDALTEGSHTIYFKVSDDCGNVSMWSWQFYKDTEPPSIPALIAPANGALLINRTPTFVWHTSMDAQKYEIMYADNSLFANNYVKYLTDTAYTAPSPFTADTIYWTVKAIDAAGNHSFWAPKWYFTYDNEAPLPPTLVSPIDDVWLNYTSVELDWTEVTRKNANNTAVRYIVQVDDNNAFASPFTDTTAATSYTIVLGEGVHYWRVRAYDLAGNQGNFSSTESFGIDVTLPSDPTPVVPPDSAIQNISTIVFIWNASTDNLSGIDHYVLQYTAFGAPTSVNVTDTSYTSGALADSTYWWRVRAVDMAGNEGPWSNRWYVTIDTQIPNIPTLIAPADLSYTNDVTPTFQWTQVTSRTKGTPVTYCLQVATDTLFGPTSLVIDTCGLTNNSYTVTDSLLLGNLAYYWHVEAIDDAGNNSGYQAQPFMFTIDNIPPDIPTLFSPANSTIINNNTPQFVWSSTAGGGTYTLEYALDNLFTSPVTILGIVDTTYTLTDTLADTIYYWHVKAIDLATNESDWSAAWHFEIDTQAPIVPTLISPSDSSYLADTIVVFEWTEVLLVGARGGSGGASGLSSEVRYILQVDTTDLFAEPLIVDTVPLTIDTINIAEGTYFWRVKAYDLAGNQGDFSAPFYFVVDITAPGSFDLISPPDSIWLNTARPSFEWQASSDPISGIKQYHIYIDDILRDSTLDTLWAANYDLGEGYHNWYVVAYDNAGNNYKSAERTIAIDLTPPRLSGTTIWANTDFQGPYPVTSIASDALSGLESVLLYYKFGLAGTWDSVAMQPISPIAYKAEIPAVPWTSTPIYYYVGAEDLATNTALSPEGAPDSAYSFIGWLVGVAEGAGLLPTVFALSQNNPNPFIQSTVISYSLPGLADRQPTAVSLRIYSLSGRLVRTLVDEPQGPGYYKVMWDGRDDQGERASPGIYFYRIRAPNYTSVRKMALMR